MITEKENERINKGGVASIAKGYYKNFLEMRRERLISELCNFYKGNDLQFPIICGKLGELTLINDSLRSMDSDIREAQKLEGKLYDSSS